MFRKLIFFFHSEFAQYKEAVLTKYDNAKILKEKEKGKKACERLHVRYSNLRLEETLTTVC